MGNSGWTHVSLHQCGSGIEHSGQGESQKESRVELGHAGHEVTGSSRLTGKMTTTWPCSSYLFPAAIQLLRWESFSYF